jgi:hypothetical protein
MIRDVLNKGRSDQLQNWARGVMIKGRFDRQGRSDQGTLYHGIILSTGYLYKYTDRLFIYAALSSGYLYRCHLSTEHRNAV